MTCRQAYNLEQAEKFRENEAYERGRRDALDWAANELERWFEAGNEDASKIFARIRRGPVEG